MTTRRRTSDKRLAGRPRPGDRFRISAALVCGLGLAPTACWPAETASSEAKAPSVETLVLRVFLNTEDKGDLFVARTSDRDFLVKLQDLKTMGFRNPSGTLVVLEGEPHISLRSMHGVSFSFEEKTLALNIMAEPGLLPSRSLQLQAERTLRSVHQGSSGFLNYALDYARSDGGSGGTVGFSGELGWRSGQYLFLSDVNLAERPDGRRHLVRLTSSLTHDDMDNLRRTVVGDFFTPSRELSSGVNLGGVSVSKLYGLNPYLVQFPMQTVSGTVALPSDLEVYLDGQRIRSEKLKPGEFELRDIQAYGGARSVRLVLRDAFGRVQEFDYSFYFTDQPLRQGLHEYSYAAGAIRRDYGVASNHYGPGAFTLFHRYGLTDAITLGLRGEGKRDFYNAGPVATFVLGSAGVVNLALAGSSVDNRRGAAASLAYNYQARRWNVGLALRKDRGDYATLGDPPIISHRRYEGSAFFSYNMPGWGAVSLTHSARSSRVDAGAVTPTQILDLAPAEKQRVTALSYSVPLFSGLGSLTATLSHIKDTSSRNELTLRLITFLGRDHSLVTTFQGNREQHAESMQLTKNQPIGEGLGYVLVADRTTDLKTRSLRGKSTIQYNATAAILRGEYGRSKSSGAVVNDYRLAVAGGVAYVDGTVGFGRPVTGSFGIVKVGELADVAVSVNGQPMGRTNSSGKLFLPTLNSHFDNAISIAPESVPIEYSIPATTKKISPALRGGVMIDFGVTKVQAFTGKLLHADGGANKPVEFLELSFDVEGKTQALQTGRGGEFYFENVKPATYAATVLIDGRPCRFDLIIPKSEETFVELGELVCRPQP